MSEAEVKKGRGRPAKTTTKEVKDEVEKSSADEAPVSNDDVTEAPKEKRGRGRPRGSKKPPKKPYDGPKRGRGRPKKAE